MRYKAIFFDLDGTLLPMDFETFTNGYFSELAKVLSPLGIEPKALISAIWGGTKMMVKNNGEKPNREVFWETFSELTGKEYKNFLEASDKFYTNEFNNAKVCVGENPLADTAVKIAAQKAEKVVLATNPLFPLDGQKTRLSWINVDPSLFSLITSYESDSYCKPNPKYYLEICKRIDVSPCDCLMIGNDVCEDMFAAEAAGLDAYLVTDCLIPDREGREWQGKRGSFSEMIEMLNDL